MTGGCDYGEVWGTHCLPRGGRLARALGESSGGELWQTDVPCPVLRNGWARRVGAKIDEAGHPSPARVRRRQRVIVGTS